MLTTEVFLFHIFRRLLITLRKVNTLWLAIQVRLITSIGELFVHLANGSRGKGPILRLPGDGIVGCIVFLGGHDLFIQLIFLTSYYILFSLKKKKN